jgi:hypothetical protein
MGHEWVIAQLDAMEQYCQINGLPRLAESLADARLLATLEILGQAAPYVDTIAPVATPGTTPQ